MNLRTEKTHSVSLHHLGRTANTLWFAVAGEAFSLTSPFIERDCRRLGIPGGTPPGVQKYLDFSRATKTASGPRDDLSKLCRWKQVGPTARSANRANFSDFLGRRSAKGDDGNGANSRGANQTHVTDNEGLRKTDWFCLCQSQTRKRIQVWRPASDIAYRW